MVSAAATLEDCAVLVDGVSAAVRGNEVVNHGRRGSRVSRRASNHKVQALHALDSWTRAPRPPPFALLDATLALDSVARWLWQGAAAGDPAAAQGRRDVGPRAGRRRRITAGTSRAGCSLAGYLERLVELDALIRRRPVDQGKRLTAGELPR